MQRKKELWAVYLKRFFCLFFHPQTTTLNSTICRVGEFVNVLVNVVPVSQVSVYWRINKTDNWTQAPIECKAVGEIDVYVMAENGISVSSSECFELITGKK